jgi:hypothetical protein
MSSFRSQQGGSSKCFGFVNRYDAKPERRLFSSSDWCGAPNAAIRVADLVHFRHTKLTQFG